MEKIKWNNWYGLSKYRTELMGIAALCILIFHSAVTNELGGVFCPNLYNFNNTVLYYLFFVVSKLNIGVEIFLLVSGIGLYYAYEKKPKLPIIIQKD